MNSIKKKVNKENNYTSADVHVSIVVNIDRASYCRRILAAANKGDDNVIA